MKSILAIVVLYRMSPEQSPPCTALLQAMQAGPAAAAMELIIADNSPQPQSAPPLAHYIHDGRNLGLAERYNEALARAAASGATWLLVFDQDTTLTHEYLGEVLELAASLHDKTDIAAVVPKLVMQGRLMSPHTPPYNRCDYTVTEASEGVLSGRLCAFNSGALLRVSALQAIGGFPTAYWLDYLDHATFHRLQQQCGKIYVMRSMLEHELSESVTTRQINPVRLLNRLQAQERFYSEHGTRSERLQHRLDLLRQVIGHGRRGRFHEARARLTTLLHLF